MTFILGKMVRPYNISINGETLKSLIRNNIVDGNEYLFDAIEHC
jgi:hypothetical protein